jgi:uncharacterized protein (TIGR04551 family)
LRAPLAWLVLALAHPARATDLRWTADGYYRTRATYARNVANETAEPIREVSFFTQRLRLEPRLSLDKIVTLQITADALDDVIWGDNNAQAVAPLFANNPSNTNLLGKETDTLVVKRAWLELMLPVGLIRVGRMPSHWGLGLLANGGGTAGCPGGCPDGYFDDDFGDNHFGSVNDRVLFATRPLQAVKTLLHASDPSSNLIFAYAYDKLVEDWFNIPLERELDEQTPPETQRGQGESLFLANADDDVQQHVFVLVYDNPDWNPERPADELRGGLYVVLRTQPRSRIVCDPQTLETDPSRCQDAGRGPNDLVFVGDGSFIHIWDFWWRLRWRKLYSESEFYWILGHTDGGIPIGTLERQKKTAHIFGGALRVGYASPRADATFEAGRASGDDDVGDDRFTQRSLHPDYHVGLVLYDQVLREYTARRLGRLEGLDGRIADTRGLQSDGGVSNSRYLFPRVKFRPVRPLELVGGVVLAWVDEKGFEFPKRDEHGLEYKSFLGWEVDGGATVKWAEDRLRFTIEGGYLRFGDALKSGDDRLLRGVVGAGTIQSRIAFVF